MSRAKQKQPKVYRSFCLLFKTKSLEETMPRREKEVKRALRELENLVLIPKDWGGERSMRMQ